MQLLRLKYYQLRRDFGIWTILIALGVYFLVDWFCSLYSLSPILTVSIAAVLLYSYHQQRLDKDFIRQYLRSPDTQLIVHYFLLLFPVFLALAIHTLWYYMIALATIILLIVLLEFRMTTLRLLYIGRLIPSRHFEWISGIRKHFLSVVLLSLPVLILSPVKLFGLVFLSALNILFISFFQNFEPIYMLNPLHLSARKFLQEKINFFGIVLTITNIPVLLINSIFNPDAIWFNVLFFLTFFMIAGCSVYIKYAQYEPNESLRMNADHLILISALFIPALFPVCILLYFHNRGKAINNLSTCFS